MPEILENKASRGSIIQIILTALSSGDKYGYEICKEIEELSDGLLVLKQPSLYSSLRRMEEQNLISSYWEDSEIGGKRHYYRLTEDGQKLYEENKANLDMKELIKNLPLQELDIEPSNLNSKITVANQETLFNFGKNNDIKIINEDDNKEENDKSFFQFDFFDQNINLVNTPNKQSNIEAYNNKYSKMDNHGMEIEPQKSSDIQPILRQEVFKKDNEETTESHNSLINEESKNNLSNSNENYSDNVVRENNNIMEELLSTNSLLQSNTETDTNYENNDKNLLGDNIKDNRDIFDTNNIVNDENSQSISNNTDNDINYFNGDIFDNDRQNYQDNNELSLQNNNKSNDDNLNILKDFNSIPSPLEQMENNNYIDSNSSSNEDGQKSDAKINITNNVDFESNQNGFTNDNEETNDLSFDDNKEKTQQMEEKEQNNDVNSKEIIWADTSSNCNEESNFQTSNDYKMIIGQLYNNSQLPDPYEENKFYSFKEIFPSSHVQQTIKKEKPDTEIDLLLKSTTTNVNTQNLDILSRHFKMQGLKLKEHNALQNKNNKHSYTDINRLNMVTSWFVSFIMLMEIIFSYILLNNANYIVQGQSLMYFLGGSISICISIIATLENYFDRYKLIEVKLKFKKDFTRKLLAFIIIAIIDFAICLICGMQNLLEINFLSYWLVPVLVSSNLVVFSLIYYALLKSKNFNN